MIKILFFLVFSGNRILLENLTNFPKSPMQESHQMPPPPPPPPTAKLPLHPEIDLLGENNTSVPVPAGDRLNDRPSPVSSLEHLKGKLVSEAMDPYGCQFLHQKLQERKSEDIQMIFSEVKDRICLFMLNRFGSDLLQKLYKVCNEEQMTQLVSSLTADLRLLLVVCLDSQGSESMQEFLGLMTRNQIVHMISFFTYIMVLLANDQFGSCVIRRCFDMFPVPAVETNPIVDLMADNCLELAYDKNGSCLLQGIISKVTIPKSNGLQRIISTIMLQAYDLSRDEFGSRLMLHVIGLEMPTVAYSITYKIGGHFPILSIDEYGSIVVTKLIEAFNGKYASEITQEIITSPAFLSVLVDPHGYSVIQSAKTYTNGIVLWNLNNLIRQHSVLLDKK